MPNTSLKIKINQSKEKDAYITDQDIWTSNENVNEKEQRNSF